MIGEFGVCLCSPGLRLEDCRGLWICGVVSVFGVYVLSGTQGRLPVVRWPQRGVRCIGGEFSQRAVIPTPDRLRNRLHPSA